MDSPIGQSPLLDSIQDPRMKERLYQEYKNVAEQARNNMMTLSMACAEEQKRQCHEDYEIAVTAMLNSRKKLTTDPKITQPMCDLIQQRLANIGARIECEYSFKTLLVQLRNKSE